MAPVLNLYEAVGFGVFGGFCSEFAVFLVARHKRTLPKNILKVTYLLIGLIGLLVSAGLVYTYARNEIPLTSITAMHLGASMPLVLKKMANHDISIPD